MSSDQPPVSRFREYLRIQTVPPRPDYDGAMTFLAKQAENIGLEHEIIEIVSGKPIMVMTWQGTDTTLPTVLLNSHTDVVPVYPEMWKYGPFEAVKDEDGNIYGRGAQDMKCVGMQYLEAIRRLKEAGEQPLRTIHLTFVPDEEIGGHDGMMVFVKSQHFADMNVGFALDEGVASTTEEMEVFYWERIRVVAKVTFHGNPGHASMFIENTAAEKLRRFVNLALDYRESEKQKLESNPDLKIGDVTTLNMNIIEGGVQLNVVPATLRVHLDTRVTPTFGSTSFTRLVQDWCRQAGAGVDLEARRGDEVSSEVPTPTGTDHPWFGAFKAACDNMNLKLSLGIFPALTDSRYLRQLGIPALGFSPMNHTPILLHDHNEFLNEKIYLRGIDIYTCIIPKLANVTPY